MRIYGYYTEYKLAADRRCDTGRAKDIECFEEKTDGIKVIKVF